MPIAGSQRSPKTASGTATCSTARARQTCANNGTRPGWPSTSFGFLSEIGWIAVDGDTARASSQAREIIRLKDGGLFKLIGRYDDYLVSKNGQWLFSRRNYQPLVLEEPGG